MRPILQFLWKPAATALLVLLCSGVGNSYSVLTHEEVVDLLWKDQIQPLLLKRFPAASAEDLRQAHSYAYGGGLLQDMGYYPFRQQVFQRSGPLRSHRGFCERVAPAIFRY